MDAHLAACAAGEQGKFLEFTKLFWQKGFGAYKASRDPSALGKANILKMAKDLKLNVAKLKKDMEGDKCKSQIKNDMAELQKFRVGGTPSFFVNGRFTMFSGPDAFDELIKQELEAVKASGIPADQYYQKEVMDKGEKAFKSRQG